MQRRRASFCLFVIALTCWLSAVTNANAQTTFTPVVPDPSECKVERRGPESFTGLQGTPAPFPPEMSEATLPTGDPIDQKTLDDVTAVERELIACLNGGDPARVFALVTDKFLLQVMGAVPDAATADLFLLPATPVAVEDRVSLVTVRDGRQIEMNRVGAVSEWGSSAAPDVTTQAQFHVFVKVDDKWRIDEEITLTDVAVS